jgi:hypothetical protein
MIRAGCGGGKGEDGVVRGLVLACLPSSELMSLHIFIAFEKNC